MCSAFVCSSHSISRPYFCSTQRTPRKTTSIVGLWLLYVPPVPWDQRHIDRLPSSCCLKSLCLGGSALGFNADLPSVSAITSPCVQCYLINSRLLAKQPLRVPVYPSYFSSFYAASNTTAIHPGPLMENKGHGWGHQSSPPRTSTQACACVCQSFQFSSWFSGSNQSRIGPECWLQSFLQEMYQQAGRWLAGLYDRAHQKALTAARACSPVSEMKIPLWKMPLGLSVPAVGVCLCPGAAFSADFPSPQCLYLYICLMMWYLLYVVEHNRKRHALSNTTTSATS